MRKIDFRPPTTKAWQRWETKCRQETAKCIDDVAHGKEPEFSDLYKRQKDFFISENGPFFGKCSYCEQKITPNQHGDVDHFRPKKGIRDIDWKPVTYRHNGHEIPHPGYYWLAYDWRNLLLGCTLCNQIPAGGRSGKSNRFPVEGKYARRPGEEANERPLLINPCVEDPGLHLDVDSTGILSAKTSRGAGTIKVLGLNDRDLPQERSDVYQDTMTAFDSILTKHGRSQLLQKLRKDNERRSFSTVRRAALKAAVAGLLADLS